MILALFDFDGTITKKDSLLDFIQYTVGKPKYYLGLFILSPLLLLYSLRIISNNFAKEKLISYFFKGWETSQFQKLADQYALERINKITRPEAIAKIKWHQKEGHKVIIISASMENWIKAWCLENNIDLIATQLGVEHQRLSGKFSSKNCYGSEKVNRLNQHYDLTSSQYIYAYGDSKGDEALLGLANEAFYKPFRSY